MDFNPKPIIEGESDHNFEGSIGTSTIFNSKNQFDYLLDVKSEDNLRELNPDISFLKEIAVRSAIVTSIASSPRFVFISGFFASAIGVNEDPVTGSARCFLTSYRSDRLGKSSFTAFQASSRGGILIQRLEGDRTIKYGQTGTTVRGKLCS